MSVRLSSGRDFALARERAARVLQSLAAQAVNVTQLGADSRTIESGEVFVACPGSGADGRDFIDAAIERGACAVIWDDGAARDGRAFCWDPRWQVPNVPVTRLRELVGPLAQQVYGEPSRQLHVIGVTGTNGKTSTTQWIAQALNGAGRRCAAIGTLGIGLSDHIEPNPNTTPDPIVLARALRRFVDAGADAVAMEVSSIGLHQHRVDGVHFDCAVFTNLSRDHLDYHADMASYAAAKLALFEWDSLSHIVTNLDDPIGVRAARIARRGVRRIGYSLFPDVARRSGLDGYLEAHRIRHDADGVAFDLVSDQGHRVVSTQLVGRFNVSNLLAVVGVLCASGCTLDEAVARIAALLPVPGRMERLGGADRPTVIVDYAHTPDALEKVLHASREVARSGNGRLLAVFGCGGNRDRGKRALMGAIAARLADVTIVTSDNPRDESPQAIIDEIVRGMGAAQPRIVLDRAAAIDAAVGSAGRGDVIVLAGKGHEPYQEIAGVRRPFSDLAHARRALGLPAC